MTPTLEQTRRALETHLKHWVGLQKGKTHTIRSYVCHPGGRSELREYQVKSYITDSSLTDERRRFMAANPGFLMLDSLLRVNYDIGPARAVEEGYEEMYAPVHPFLGLTVSAAKKEVACI